MKIAIFTIRFFWNMNFKPVSKYSRKSYNKRRFQGGLFVIILVSLFLFPFSIALGQLNSAQSGVTLSYSVKWVGEYPSKGGKQNSGFMEKVSGIILGKKKVEITKPFAILGKSPDNFWVLDQGSGTLIKNDNGQSEVPPALRKENMQYPSLTGICSFPNNQILFTDSRLNKIFILSSNQKDLRVLNDSLSLDQPTGIAWSNINKEIWVVETHAHRIAILNPKGEIIRRIGRRGSGHGEFNYPTFIWIDSSGKVYIVDSMNFRLQIFNKEGEFISSLGEIGDASGYFARPKGVATDSHGHIYIADALYHVVQIYDKDGNFLYYFGSQGHNKEQFWMPTGIFIDEKDYIYVADTYNSRVQIFQLVEEPVK